MQRDIVLVHTSDVHLDAESDTRGHGDSTLALAAVLDATRAANADLLLLAGDIFESNRQSDAFLERIAAMLAAASAPMVVLPGNHDPIADLRERDFEQLYTRIVNLAPAPVGLG